MEPLVGDRTAPELHGESGAVCLLRRQCMVEREESSARSPDGRDAVPAWVRSLAMPLWVTDSTGNVSFLNARAETLFGRTFAEVAGQSCDVAIGAQTPDGTPGCPHCRHYYEKHEPAEIEPARMQVPIKTGRPVEVSVVGIEVDGPGGPLLVHCVVNDARERRLRRFLSGLMLRRSAPADANVARGWDLTPREREVLSLVADGLSMHEIAAKLNVSYATVRNHMQHVFAKLGVHSILEAVAVWVMEDEGGS